MARINVEQKALTDARFAELGSLLLHPEKTRDLLLLKYYGLGAMVMVWNECQERESYFLDASTVEFAIGKPGSADAVVTARLAVRNRSGKLRVCGAKERCMWLKEVREKGRRGAEHGKKGGRPKENTKQTLNPVGGSPYKTPRGGKPGKPPPAPAPAPAPAPGRKTPDSCARRSGGSDPPDGFLAAWAAYPHHQRRSVRKQAVEVWLKLGLERHAANVLTWIAAYRETDDWRREGGRLVPGMQVWLKRPDFTSEPEPVETGPRRAGNPVVDENRAMAVRLCAGEVEGGLCDNPVEDPLSDSDYCPSCAERYAVEPRSAEEIRDQVRKLAETSGGGARGE